MPEFSEQDRPPETITESRKKGWFDAFMERTMNEGVRRQLESDEYVADDFLYTYEFTAAELRAAGIDPAEVAVNLLYGSGTHPEAASDIVPAIVITFEKFVLHNPHQTVILEQKIRLHYLSADHITEFVDRPVVKDSSASHDPDSMAITKALELEEEMGRRLIDRDQAHQLDRLSQLK